MKMEKNPVYKKWRNIRYILSKKMQVPGDIMASSLIFQRITSGVKHVLVSW